MSDDLDYDTDNYTIEELQNFFKLDKIHNYGIEEINYSFNYLKTNSPNKDFVIFLLKVKEILTNEFFSRKIDNFEREQTSLDIELQRYKKEQNSILVPDTKPSINGAEYNYICKKLVINSKFRKEFTKTNSNDFSIQLPYLFNNVISLEFKSMDYSNSFYNITNNIGNNHLSINGIDYVIPDGNYTSVDLLGSLNSITPSSIDFSLNKITGKISIISIDIFDLSFGIEGIYETIKCPPNNPYKRVCPETEKLVKSYNMYENLGYLLGFRNFEYSNSNTYTAESILDVNHNRFIYLYIDDFINSSSYDSLITINSNKGDYFSSKIIARIANTEDNYNVKFQDSSDTIDRKRFYYGPVNLQKLHFRILDEKGELLDMNNTDFSVMLEIKMINK